MKRPATDIHPKVKAAGLGTAVVVVIVAIAAIAGVNLDDNTTTALLIIVGAAIPTGAGYAKAA